jgi:GT2 family glycosyltransferase
MFLAPAPERGVEPGLPPTFTVVVPAYQAAETIGPALASLAAQTRAPEEIVVCDDGSTDALEEAVEPWREHVVLLRKENGGGASALNAAAHAATSDFVVILDADDTYEPRRIEALAELAAARPDLDLATTDAHLEVAGQIRGRFTDGTPFVTDDQRRGILRSCFVGGWPAIRRTTLLEAGGFDESLRIGYDWECWIRLILAGSRAGCVDEPLMTYRLHAGGVTADRATNLRARVEMLERVDRRPLDAGERATLAETWRAERAKLRAARSSLVRRAWSGIRRA